jgi:hypothetical protein
MSDPKEALWERVSAYEQSVIVPLYLEGQIAEMLARAETFLPALPPDESRKSFMSTIASLLAVSEGFEEQALVWLNRRIAEDSEDPMGWSALASHHWIDADGGNPALLRKAMDASGIALEKAWAARKWLRWVLADRCRIAADAKRFDIVEAAMAEILDDWPCKCEIDVPFFEWDWLKRVPEGAIDPALRARYEATVAQVLAKRAERDAREAAPAGEGAPGARQE